MRIEVYDALTGHLIYIDANGDGDWLDAGDQITLDADRNGIPDITLAQDTLNADIELRFHAPPSETTEPVELTLEMQIKDHWMTQSINRIALHGTNTN